MEMRLFLGMGVNFCNKGMLCMMRIVDEWEMIMFFFNKDIVWIKFFDNLIGWIDLFIMIKDGFNLFLG